MYLSLEQAVQGNGHGNGGVTISEDMMSHLRTWISAGLASAGLRVGLHDFESFST